MTEVVAALIWDNDKFMICQRPANKARPLLWEFVGGKVEPGETKEQALIRECKEELDIVLEVGEIFTEAVHEYPDITIRLTVLNAKIAIDEILNVHKFSSEQSVLLQKFVFLSQQHSNAVFASNLHDKYCS